MSESRFRKFEKNSISLWHGFLYILSTLLILPVLWLLPISSAMSIPYLIQSEDDPYALRAAAFIIGFIILAVLLLFLIVYLLITWYLRRQEKKMILLRKSLLRKILFIIIMISAAIPTLIWILNFFSLLLSILTSTGTSSLTTLSASTLLEFMIVPILYPFILIYYIYQLKYNTE